METHSWLNWYAAEPQLHRSLPMHPSSSAQTDRRKRGKGDKNAESSKGQKGTIGDLLIKKGTAVRVELRHSIREADQEQRATLDRLQLHKRGQAKIVIYRGPSTARNLEKVRDLVEMHIVGTPKSKTRRSSRPRRRVPKGTVVNTRTYISGGGESRLLEVRGAGQLRVEAQKSSFALMWPSTLQAVEFFRAAKVLHWEEGTASLLSTAAGGIKEVPADRLLETLADKAWIFARVDFSDRALTWALEYKDPERSGRPVEATVEHAHEVSLGGLRFEEDYARDLIEATAVPPMAAIAERLAANAANTLSDYV